MRSAPHGQSCCRGAAAWTPWASPAVCVPTQSGPIKQLRGPIGLLLVTVTIRETILLFLQVTLSVATANTVLLPTGSVPAATSKGQAWETSGVDAVAVPKRLSTAGSNCPSPSSK